MTNGGFQSQKAIYRQIRLSRVAWKFSVQSFFLLINFSALNFSKTFDFTCIMTCFRLGFFIIYFKMCCSQGIGCRGRRNLTVFPLSVVFATSFFKFKNASQRMKICSCKTVVFFKVQSVLNVTLSYLKSRNICVLKSLLFCLYGNRLIAYT